MSEAKQRRHPELLIPASSLEVLKTAVILVRMRYISEEKHSGCVQKRRISRWMI